MMFCPTCGKEIPDESTFCPACGAKLASGKKEQKSKLRIILPMVLVLMLLAASFGVYYVIKSRVGQGQKVATVIPYRKGDTWGFCNRTKELVLPAVYDWAWPFADCLAPVLLSGKYGYVNTKGTLVIPALYDGAWSFADGLAQVELNDKRGYIDTMGNQYWEN